MTATTTRFRFAVSEVEVATDLPRRRRRITPELGRALEKLNHAIEYLTDEYIHQGSSITELNDHACTVDLLKTLRKQIYLDAPEVLPFAQRCKTFLTQLFA
ncbi:hypothetical protein [Occallatibacter riparius]|uniref:Uncharacterized protein n=1 Tax=Occallatibacter riparius TaxID=1002689 RepID=A0A9J7BJ56_9BACT|nr:hypothetical protein [Occallatibacter riparius]UWZ82856.1 hypothetical protein MOP44_20085 [Occallatibacter riparius]